MHTQTKKLVGAIGATAAFTAALTGGVTAVHQYSENAASASTVDTFNDFQNRIAQAKAAAADNSDHCKIHTGAFDELSYTPEPGESAHVSGSSFGLIGTSGTFNAVPADDGIAAYNCRWALTVKTNAVKYGIDGDELKDDVTVASNPTYGRDPWLVINHEMAPATVHGQVYYMKNKPELTYTLPSGAQLIGETDLDFNEPGTKTASIAKPATSLNNGYLVWVWSVDRQKQPGNWGKYMDANFIDGWGAENEVVTLPHQKEPAPTPTPTPGETTPTPAPEPTPGETTPAPTPKPTPSLPDHDGVTPPVPQPEPTPAPEPAPQPTPGEVTPTPAPVVPTPGETTPAPAPSTPGNATTDPTPTPSATTESPTPGSQDKDGKGGATNGSTHGTENGNEQGNNQAGTKSPAGSTSVDHQGTALAHTGSVTLPLLGGAALLLAVGSGLALTKRRAIDA
jgi:singapore isolate B (sub-type 7) whole genome shotgun sequence assembly, scaffold_4